MSDRMPRAWRRPRIEPSPFDVLRARACARAYLWASGEYDSIAAALAPLEEFAHASGLIRELGQDFCEQIIAGPFERFSRAADRAVS